MSVKKLMKRFTQADVIKDRAYITVEAIDCRIVTDK